MLGLGGSTYSTTCKVEGKGKREKKKERKVKKKKSGGKKGKKGKGEKKEKGKKGKGPLHFANLTSYEHILERAKCSYALQPKSMHH